LLVKALRNGRSFFAQAGAAFLLGRNEKTGAKSVPASIRPSSRECSPAGGKGFNLCGRQLRVSNSGGHQSSAQSRLPTAQFASKTDNAPVMRASSVRRSCPYRVCGEPFILASGRSMNVQPNRVKHTGLWPNDGAL